MKTTTGFKTTKQEAMAMAQHLLKKIKFKNFKIEAWENLGYHYSVDNGFVSVSPSVSDNEYFALLMPHHCYYGQIGHSKDVNELIKQTINLLVKHANEENKKAQMALESLEK